MKPKFPNHIFLASLVVVISTTGPLLAADYTWTGTTSNVSTLAANWNVGGSPAVAAPGTADNVLIDTSATNTTNIPSGNWDRRGAGTTTINGTGIVNLNTGSARFLNNGTFNLLGGQFNHSGEYFIVGNGGIGTFIHSGGTLSSTHRRGFFLSDGAANLGTTYTLSGGTMNVTSSGVDAVERKLRSVWLGKGGENAVAAGVTGDTLLVTSGTATFTRTHATNAYDLMISRNSSLQVQGGGVTFDKYSEVRIGYGTNADLGTTPTGANGSNINVSGGTLNITGGTNVRVGFADAGTIDISGTGALNLTGTLNIGTGSSKGTLTMTGGTLTVTNTGTDIIGGGNNGNATVTLSGTSVFNAATTKWKTGDFGGTGNAGTTSISLSDSAALALKEFTIGHIGGASATETVSLAGTSTLTVNNFITIGRDDNATQSGINSFLNLNGGTLSTKYIVKGSDNSDALKNNVNANGGTIKALAAEPDFFKLGTLNPGRVYVNLQAGGLNFNTNGFDVGIQAALHGTGGLTKQGAGTLTLSGTHDYTGATTVNAGTLHVVTGGSISSACTMASGTTLAVSGSGSASWAAPDLALSNGSAVSILNFDPVTYTAAAIDATNSLTATGIVTVNVPGSLSVGDYPLINYPIGGSIGGDGIGAFQLSTLPRGVVASLIDSANAVTLHVSAINALLWKGNVDSSWDIDTTSNWTLSGTPDKYLENDNVRFDDSATSFTAISLNATVAPANITFDNTTKDYTLGGTGAITGVTALSKLGDGMLTITSSNTYTGNTTVNAGTLRIGDGVSDGSLASPLIINDATVIFNTTETSVLSGSIDGFGTSTNLTKAGAGTLVLTGTSNTYSGTLQVNDGTLQFGNGLVNGNPGSSCTYEVATGATLRRESATAATVPLGNIIGTGMIAFNSAQAVNASANWGALSLSPGFTGTLRVEKGRVECSGNPALGGAAKVEILTGAQLLAFTNIDPYTTPVDIEGTGWGEGGYPGGLRLAAGNTATWAGNVTLTADSGIMAQRLSNFTVAGTISGPFLCEFYAGDPQGDSGTLNITPAAAVQNSYGSTRINGRPNGSIVAGNAYAFSSGPLQMVSATLKLNGNNFSFANLSGTGGTIGNFHAATPSVLTTGADNSSTTYSGVITDGGTAPLSVVKAGTGTLSLTGANAYSGGTTVNAGVLSVSSAFLGDSSTVTIASGAKIDLSTGGASDTVGEIILGGVTVSPGTYDSNHATYGTYFTGTGSLVVIGGYSAWASDSGLDGTNNGLDQDADNDGVNNLMEFYLNGDPLASDPSILPDQSQNATYLILTFSRRDDAEADVASQAVQFGSDLSGWTDVAIGAANSGPDANNVLVEVTENDTAPDTVVVKIPRALAPGGSLFGRVKVTK